MRLSEFGEHEGVESKRRGARYPATSDTAPSSSSSRDARASARRAKRRSGMAANVELVPPIKVMAVAEDPRVKGRVRVRCQADGQSVTLVIGSSGVRAFNIRTGMTLDQVSWAAISREARVVRAQDAALRMLSTSRRSRRDLELRLRRRETDVSVIADALGRLDSIGLIDDDEFALAEAAAQLRNGARSSGAVKRRLRQRGITGDVADAAVAEVVETEGINDAARCDEAAQKRVRQLRSYDRQTAERRLVGFLMRRGFDSGSVFASVRRAMTGWAAVPGSGDDLGDATDEL
jgi:regulatory protein